MELYLLRHGIAEDQSDTGRDEDRRLTAEGKKRLREVIKTAAAAGMRPDLIVSSPYLRAVESARVAMQELGYQNDLLTANSLTPEARPDEAWTEIRSHRDQAQLLLASHNPLCSILTGQLLASPNLWIDFKKGSIVRIDFDQFGATPHGILRWMLTPKLSGS